MKPVNHIIVPSDVSDIGNAFKGIPDSVTYIGEKELSNVVLV